MNIEIPENQTPVENQPEPEFTNVFDSLKPFLKNNEQENPTQNNEEGDNNLPEDTEEKQVKKEKPEEPVDLSKLTSDFDFGVEDISEVSTTGEDFFKSLGIDKDHENFESFKPVIDEINKKTEAIKTLHTKLKEVSEMDIVKQSIAQQAAKNEFQENQVDWANEFEEYFPEEAKQIQSLKKAEKEKILNLMVTEAYQAHLKNKIEGKKTRNPFIAAKSKVFEALKPKPEPVKQEPVKPETQNRKQFAAVPTSTASTHTGKPTMGDFVKTLPEYAQKSTAKNLSFFDSLSDFL